MSILTVTHTTTYRYARPVRFEEHRMMMRPRDSHDLRLIDTSLTVSPPADIRWLHDVFGNSVALARFRGMANELYVKSVFRAQHYPLSQGAVTIEEYARRVPFSYDAAEVSDLGRTAQRNFADPAHRIDAWAREFAEPGASTMEVLQAITDAIKDRFTYNPRDEMGTQHPLLTLERGSGTCRDYALFMMEAVRSLGFAARFVSGYLYDETLVEREEPKVVGSGATHAWVQVYLPGAGWVEFDPTNGLAGGRNLIRVAVTRDPSQAVPLSGSFVGRRDAFLDLQVEVTITSEAKEAEPREPVPGAQAQAPVPDAAAEPSAAPP